MGTISVVIATYSSVAAGGHPIPRPPGVPGPQGGHLPGAAMPIALNHAPVRPQQREGGRFAYGVDRLRIIAPYRRAMVHGGVLRSGRRPVSGAAGSARNEAITCCAQSDLGTTKCPTPGMVTSVARLSGLAAACAACGDVMAS